MLSVIVEQSMLIACCFPAVLAPAAETRIGQFEDRTVYKQEKREGSRPLSISDFVDLHKWQFAMAAV